MWEEPSRRELLKVASATPFIDASNHSSDLTVSQEPISPSSFGAVGDGIHDDTEAVQSALDAAVRSGRDIQFSPGTFKVRSLSVYLQAGSLSTQFRMRGAGRRATTLLHLTDEKLPLLRIIAAGKPTDANVDLTDLCLKGAGSKGVGLYIESIAHSAFERLIIEGFRVGFKSLGSLVLLIENLTVHRNGVGLLFDKSDGVFANSISLRDCRVNLNRVGLDFSAGSLLKVIDCTFEGNGAAKDLETGGIILRRTVDNETGFSLISLVRTWFENNDGWSFRAESSNLILNISSTKFLSSAQGRAVAVARALSVSLDDILVPSAPDYLLINCGRLSIRGGFINALRGVQQERSIQNVAFATAPVEGTYQSMLQLGDGNELRFSWANNTGHYAFKPMPTIGSLALMGSGAQRLDSSVDINLLNKSLSVNGKRVVGPQQPAISDPKPGEEGTTLLRVLNALREHGLIGS